MNFSQALIAIKEGKKMSREGWNGKGMWIQVQFPDENSANTRSYIFIVCPKGSTKQFGEQTKDFERVPWLASQTDIFAEDWQEVA